MKKKLSALFMVFAMVLSLFSGLGVNTIWAGAVPAAIRIVFFMGLRVEFQL